MKIYLTPQEIDLIEQSLILTVEDYGRTEGFKDRRNALIAKLRDAVINDWE